MCGFLWGSFNGSEHPGQGEGWKPDSPGQQAEQELITAGWPRQGQWPISAAATRPGREEGVEECLQETCGHTGIPGSETSPEPTQPRGPNWLSRHGPALGRWFWVESSGRVISGMAALSPAAGSRRGRGAVGTLRHPQSGCRRCRAGRCTQSRLVPPAWLAGLPLGSLPVKAPGSESRGRLWSPSELLSIFISLLRFTFTGRGRICTCQSGSKQ